MEIKMLDLRIADVDIKTVLEATYDGGCSKRRKAEYFFADAAKESANAVVTAGAANSNHAKVTALMCAERGWKCVVVVHDNEDYQKSNLLLMKLAGAQLVFTTLDKVKEAMNFEMESLRDSGYRPYYIYGGGHGLPGYLAFFDAAKDFIESNPDYKPDYVVHASGTGGTQAGLTVGFNQCSPKTKVVGISVARNASRGTEVVQKSCNELCEYLGISTVSEEKVCFRDDWVGGGYGSIYPELLSTIKDIASKHGLITDPTYTGKALHGLVSMVRSGEIEPGSKVVFWHTGGLINLFEYTQELVE